MKATKEKTAVAAREAKRRLENPVTDAQKSEKFVVEVERQQKIQRTAIKKFVKTRVEAKRRSAINLLLRKGLKN